MAKVEKDLTLTEEQIKEAMLTISVADEPEELNEAFCSLRKALTR